MMIEIRETPATPVETVTPLKPSEAMRLGCLTYPVQTFGENRAMGCAVDAMNAGLGSDGFGVPDDIAEVLSDIPCPYGCRRQPGSLMWAKTEGRMLPAHLNDTHRWTRERIADYLDTEHGL